MPSLIPSNSEQMVVRAMDRETLRTSLFIHQGLPVLSRVLPIHTCSFRERRLISAVLHM